MFRRIAGRPHSGPWTALASGALAVMCLAACASVGPRRSPKVQLGPPPEDDAAATHTAAAEADAPGQPTPVRPRLQSSSSGCIDGARTLQTPEVCLKVPAGYEVVDEHSTHVTLAHEDAPPIRLQWSHGSAALLEELRGGLELLAQGDPTSVSGETCDGRGAFVFAAQPDPSGPRDIPEVRRALSVGRSTDGLLVRCSVEAAAEDAVTRELFEACQTLSFPAAARTGRG